MAARRQGPTPRPQDAPHHLGRHPPRVPAQEQLGERIHVVVVRPHGKRRHLLDEIVDPRPRREAAPVRAGRPGQVDVPRFDARRTGGRALDLVALRLDGDDAWNLVSERIDHRGAVRGVFDQNRPARMDTADTSAGSPDGDVWGATSGG